MILPHFLICFTITTGSGKFFPKLGCVKKNKSIPDHVPLLVCSVTIISKTSPKQLDHVNQHLPCLNDIRNAFKRKSSQDSVNLLYSQVADLPISSTSQSSYFSLHLMKEQLLVLINDMNYLASLVSQAAIALTQFQMNLLFNQMDSSSFSKSSSPSSSSSSSSFQTWMIATVQVKTDQPSFQIELNTQSCRHNHHHHNTVIIIITTLLSSC